MALLPLRDELLTSQARRPSYSSKRNHLNMSVCTAAPEKAVTYRQSSSPLSP
jgi:hypothetical protein